MSGVRSTDQAGGWWLAEDGEWYPPDQHPDWFVSVGLQRATADLEGASRGGLGEVFLWGWRTLFANIGLAAVTSLVLVVIVVGCGVALRSWIALAAETRAGPFSVLLLAVAAVVMLAGLSAGAAVCISVWYGATLESQSLAPLMISGLRRTLAAFGVLVLLLPVVFVPLSAGFVMVALNLAVGGGLRPVTAVSEAVSRVAASGSALLKTLIVGLAVNLYGLAALVLILVVTQGIRSIPPDWTPSRNGSFVVEVLGWAVALGVPVVLSGSLLLALVQYFGFTGSAWTRVLAGERLAPPIRGTRVSHGVLVTLVAASMCLLVGGFEAGNPRDRWIPVGYKRFDQDFAYRFTDDGECLNQGGCYYIEVLSRETCPSRIQIELSEFDSTGEFVGQIDGLEPARYMTFFAISSLISGSSTARVVGIGCL